MIYSHQEANQKIEELKIESAKIIKEFEIYFNAHEPIKITYEAVLAPMGWVINSYLLFGDNIIRKYNVPELANLELNELILGGLLQLKNE